MIISKTPFRISFFGGGSDYPDWYLENGGRVLSTTINKYLYISLKELPKFFPHNYRISYSRIECVNNISEIKHIAVREVLKRYLNKYKCEINCISDLPARSGIGSSSTFSVGLLNAVYNFQGKKISKKDLYKKAIHLERNILNENVGSQDQVAAAVGGLNSIEFNKNGKIHIRKINCKRSRVIEFQNKLLLFYTGKQRKASSIAKEHINTIKKKTVNMSYFSDLALEAEKIFLSNKNLDILGELLHESWEKKKKISTKISSSKIDEYYHIAKKSGALGGKILGAGGGGFLLIFCNEKKKNIIKKNLNFLENIDFSLEKEGSRIINL